jgi:tRNA (guanine37-N1)-methyltransferase
MLLKPEPFFDAVDWVRERYPVAEDRVVLLSPQGGKLTDKSARRLAGYSRVILLCGRYEGVDERVRLGLADEELSAGDVVLSGGELPAMMTVEAVSRFIPGVLGRSASAESDSFADGGLGSPYYTRPAEFRGRKVPDVLLSGDHGAITRWRVRMAQEATRIKRPDLLEGEGHGAPGRRGRGSR